MHDVFGLVAWPGHVLLACGQWCAHGVKAGHKFAFDTQHVIHGLAHSGHDFHVDGDIGAVRQLNANVRDRRAQWAHAEGHNIHGAALHAAVKQWVQGGAHFNRIRPVIGWASVFFFGGTDVSAVFNPGHVGWVAARQKAVWAFAGAELFKRSRIDQLLAQTLVFSVAAIAPVNGIRLAQGGHVGDPGNQFCVFNVAGRVQRQPLHGRMVHRKSSTNVIKLYSF